MHVGMYAGSIRLDDRTYTAQDLVKLLAERDEMIARLADLGPRYYELQSVVGDWHDLDRRTRQAEQCASELRSLVQHALLPHANGLHVVYTIPTKPGTVCYDNCGRCLAEKLLNAIDAA